ncbi:MAG: spermidine/putrescine transport system permease protein [Actinomycetota bacterium]|nr:spermidine/putrescine transport system permease protein [Actinomycetota bacterium]
MSVDAPPEPDKRQDTTAAPPAARTRVLWPALAFPGTLWLVLLFLVPLYVVLAIVFGQVDPIFRSPVPVWNPLHWNTVQFQDVFSHIIGSDGFFGPALLRTAVYVLSASALCLLIAYPVAYYTARYAGRRRGLLLTLLIAPFWISYMMRMLAWVNLLQNDGLVNRALGLGGLFNVQIDWLNGRGLVVVLGLVYGYVPYMILPLYAGLDRFQPHVLEAARDLGAGRFEAFRRVTLPLSIPAIVASVLLTCLPMLGDYFTNDLLSASPSTSMVGNLINNSVLTPGQTGQAGAFVLLVLVVSLVPMIIYVRSARSEGVAS